MKCPKCGKEMTQREMDGVRYHVCEDCKVRRKVEVEHSENISIPDTKKTSPSPKPHKKRVLISLSCIALLAVIIIGVFIYWILWNKNDSGYYKDSSGNNVYENDREKTTFLKQLPFSMEYNDSTVDFVSVNLYQDNSASGYGYNIYATVEIDVSSLSDDEIYWIKKSYDSVASDNKITANLYVDDKKNNLDFHSLTSGNVYIDGSKWIFCFYDTQEFKYDFKDAEFSAYINLQQEETYEYEDSISNRTYKYNYQISGKEIKEASEMPEEIVDTIIESMGDLMDLYDKIFQ